ncbi:MAG: beta-propeller fold lactonase family protein, partial [Acidobacteria bacterium]|nr:beta-propeller fold lactonase family protein [Acidobacteriota bacterium]
ERGGPLHLSFSPDGTYAFVTLNLAEHVAVIDVDKAELVTLIRVGKRPRDVGVTPDGRKVFVSLQAEPYIAVFDVGTWRVRTLGRTVTEYKLPGSGSGLDVSWDGKLVAVNNTIDNEVVFFDTQTETVVARVGKLPPVTVNSVFLGKTPYYAAISWGGGGITIVDTRDFQTVKFVRTGNTPNAALYGPDGFIWVTHHNELYIALLDPRSFEVVRKIDVGAGTHLVTFSPNGRLAVVDHPMGRSISFIDVETYEVVDQVYVGAGPDAPVLKVDVPLRTLRTWQARAGQARSALSKAVVLVHPEPRTEREKVFLGACSICHDMPRVAVLDRLFLSPDRAVRAEQWTSIVRRMVFHGAPLMPEQEKLVVDYLTDREYEGFVDRVKTRLQEEMRHKVRRLGLSFWGPDPRRPEIAP